MMLTTIKSQFFLSVLLMMLIIFLLSHNFSNLEEGTVKTKLLNVEPHSRSKKLVQVLRRASMLDRSVILTFVDQTWTRPGSILDLFLESFRIGQGTKPFLDHLVIVALDSQAFQHCKSIHPHCFYLTNSQMPLLLPSLKYNLMRQVIELGYHLFFTEADVMWLRNPVSHIHRLKELAIVCNFYSDDPPSSISNKVDGGFFYLSSDDVSLEYLKYLDFKRVLYPNSQNQSLCEATVNDYISQLIDFRVTYLEEDSFSGFCQKRRNMGQIVTMRADCCDSIESKVHDLKLLLDDWRNFTALSREYISLGGSSFTWRAPSKCKG